MKIETIHDSLINGQRRQMVEQIDEYGMDFWADYKEILDILYINTSAYEYFADATISYVRIKGR